MAHNCRSILLLVIVCFMTQAIASTRSIFPLQAYNQSPTYWFPPNAPDYTKPLVSAKLQQQAHQNLLKHYFGGSPTSSSPWDEHYVQQKLSDKGTDSIASSIKKVLERFDNVDAKGDSINYGSNYRPYTQTWIDSIRTNVPLTQFKKLHFHAAQRGITVSQTMVRVLPTNDPSFYSDAIAGEGYPFDNLQESRLHIGTPIYVIGHSADTLWSFIMSPDLQGWVLSNSIAYADEAFIQLWRSAAKKKMAVIIDFNVALTEPHQSRIYASDDMGSILPQLDAQHLMIPVVNNRQQAVIHIARVAPDKISTLPLTASRKNFALLIQRSLGRPYGWGGLYGYNDCSSELKNLMTAFGFWLPTHSSKQITQGKTVDLSQYPPNERLDFLAKHGRPFMTLIHIRGHIMLYVGNTDEERPMTFQNIWGLGPKDRSRRSIIGQAVLFPLLLSYPEDRSLASLAAGPIFQISYLDQPSYIDKS
ncbi:SH3 domain-containing C40 family peptidase [Yersinia entomophaga]